MQNQNKYTMQKTKIILLFLFVIFISSCEKYFFYPKQQLFYMPETCACNPDNIIVETNKGKYLHGWYFKTKVKNPKGTIFFLHGNANNISTESVGMVWLLDEGYNILTFDYRGYGISQGKPNIKGVLEDGLEFTEAIFNNDQINKNNFVLYGQSLGGAVATHIARYSPYSDKFKVLVLDSTFTSWRDIAREIAASNFLTWMWQYPISWGIPKEYSSIDNLKDSKINKTIIIHSKADKLIKFKNGEELYKVSREPKILLKDDFSNHAQIIANSRIRKEFINTLNLYLK